jgi:hypothetical protein
MSKLSAGRIPEGIIVIGTRYVGDARDYAHRLELLPNIWDATTVDWFRATKTGPDSPVEHVKKDDVRGGTFEAVVFHIKSPIWRAVLDAMTDLADLTPTDETDEAPTSKLEGATTALNEAVRTYFFTGRNIELNNVVELTVLPSGTHWLKTSDGKLHIISRGWLAITIEDENGWTV